MSHHDSLTTPAGIARLTGREKQTLRLLLAGHDAKSIANHLGLSVHTVNERLRDARAKLGVTSSREAARLLAGAEPADNLADEIFGVSPAPIASPASGRASAPRPAGNRLAWIGGGMIIMALLIAAVALTAILADHASTEAQASPATSTEASAATSLEAAKLWLGLLDRAQWNDSWKQAASLFTTQITAAQWATTIAPVRQPLGRMTARTFQTVTKANVLPGTPPGAYEVLQFKTHYADKGDVVETVTLAREGSAWKVAGYFIR